MAFTRREFLAGAAGVGVGLGLGALSHSFPLPPPEYGPDWQPGVETFKASTCMLCPSHCGIRARLVDGVLTRIDGNPLHPVSQGGLCPKGSAGIQMLYHPGRLTGPIERVGEPGSAEFRSISWDDALARVAKALGEARDAGQAGSVAWLTGDVQGVMGELLQLFCSSYGSDKLLAEDYRDGSAEVMRLCHGIASPPAWDLAESDIVVSFGAGLGEAWWSLPQVSRARDHEIGAGPRWIQVDARHSRTAAAANEWLPVKPGSYGALALGVAYGMLKEGLYDSRFASQRLAGWEDWTDQEGNQHEGFKTLVLRHGRPDDVAARTGLRPAQLATLAKTFGTARRPVAVWDQAVAWRRGGLSDALCIHALNILAGSLNRPGGVLVGTRPPVSPLDPALPGSEPRFASPRWLERAAASATPPRVLFMYYSNPAASSANAAEVRRALERIPLVVSFSPFLDESARHAHLVLPDHSYLERWQDAPGPASVPYPVWGLVQPVVEPLHDTRATGDVVLQLASRLGGETAERCRWSSMEQLVRERGGGLASAERGSCFIPAYQRHELRELEERGWWLPHGRSQQAFWKELEGSGGWFDPFYDHLDKSAVSQLPDGKVWVFPPEARQTLTGEREGGSSFLPVGESGAGGDYPLALIPFRVMTLASGSTALTPWLLEHLGVLTGDAWSPWVELHPDTAQELGLGQGQRVRVESEAGGFEAPLRVMEMVQPGVVNVPYGLHTSVEGWGEPELANPLSAVGARVDPVSGLPDWYSTRVRVVPA